MSSDTSHIDELLGVVFEARNESIDYHAAAGELGDEVIRLRARLSSVEAERAAFLSLLEVRQRSLMDAELAAAQLILHMTKAELQRLPLHLRTTLVTPAGSAAWAIKYQPKLPRGGGRKGRKRTVLEGKALEEASKFIGKINQQRQAGAKFRLATYNVWKETNPTVADHRFNRAFPAIKKRYQRLTKQIGTKIKSD